MLGVGVSSLPLSNSLTPAVCPTIQLNPDTIYLETVLDSTGLELSPTKPPFPQHTHTHTPTPDISCKSEVVIVICASDQLAID